MGAPEDSTALGVLPGHKLLLEGRGFEAIKLTVIGSLGGMIFGLATLPVLFFIMPLLYGYVKPFTPWLLIAVVSYMIISENGWKEKAFALIVVLLSGFLGMVVLDYSDIMIFPLLSGLFGLPLLLIALFEKTKIPDRFTDDEDKIERKRLFSSISTGSFAGIITGILPGIGAAQATMIAQQMSRSKGEGRDFLISIGAVNMANVIYGILALWLIGKPRSGIAVAVSDLVKITPQYILIFLCVIAISAAVAAVATLKLTKPVLYLLKRANYFILNLAVIALVVALIFVFSSFYGLLVCLVATVIGLIPNYVNVRRTHCMCCLIVPVVLFYLSISLI